MPGVAFFQLVAEPSVGFGQLDFILAGDDDVRSSGRTQATKEMLQSVADERR